MTRIRADKLPKCPGPLFSAAGALELPDWLERKTKRNKRNYSRKGAKTQRKEHNEAGAHCESLAA
jgi:hypothetical protein